ncbi:LuxR C-terminal-related transcriptional regulator [Sphingobium sp. AS12]|uniref:helix-turn-helix transcriptional regulator n=1 Tax=Sphingobium sp. AS12 TaxID=2849495 RepID=UPI001C311DE9|nr:LuxR C-terminal-related transcriptional regulator [Sphingobium sp. AS12]MBV2150056.1 LuxR C-terminal-related transcriptional regulator [Sphingobium sp. AS12]
MAVILPFERRGGPPEQEAVIGVSLLNLADAYGLYSGVYLHFGHARGGAVRSIASTPIARRQYVDLIAGSNLVMQALVAHRPFAWSSREVRFSRPPETEHVGIAVPVQDHVNGPGLVALMGTGIDAARHVVSEHGPWLSWAATDIHVAALQAIRAGRTAAPTPREMDCLRMAAEGMTVATIARELSIAGRTVEFHLRNIVEKLGATSKVNAVAIAASKGLLRCDPSGGERLEPVA